MMQNLSYCSKLLAAVHDANGMAKREKNRAASSPARLEGYDNLYMDIEKARVEQIPSLITLAIVSMPLKAQRLVANKKRALVGRAYILYISIAILIITSNKICVKSQN